MQILHNTLKISTYKPSIALIDKCFILLSPNDWYSFGISYNFTLSVCIIILSTYLQYLTKSIISYNVNSIFLIIKHSNPLKYNKSYNFMLSLSIVNSKVYIF